ncbi:MAG: TIGR02996 domain-containing protein [Gemmataceae bacterium]|nr:TIGR02996 domain-containing protein [Gemmataceae bacterium]
MTPAADIRAFLRAIAAAPADDTPRLVFADWLDEHDRPERAEFIRVEVELAKTPPGSPGRATLFARRDALFRAHAAEWFAWFVGRGATWATERGFITELETPPDAFLTHAGDWFATQPITRLALTDVWVGHEGGPRCVARELFTSPLLGQLTHLGLERAGVNAAGVYWLSRNPALTGLRELSLRGNGVTDDGVRTLAGMAGLAQLECLDLTGNRVRDAGAKALIGSTCLPALRELWLSRNPIGDRTWRLLEERFGRALAG